MSITLYILEFLLCSAIFVALYKLLIEGRVSYRYSRIYLVWSMIFSAIVPILELPLYPAETVYYEMPIILNEQLSQSTIVVDEQTMHTGEITVEPQSEPINWAMVASIVAASIYGIIVLMNLARFVWRLWFIRKLRKHCELTIYEAYTLALSDQISEPFSFWRTIYMSRQFQGREKQQVVTHELSHVRHNHTAERLVLELMRCVFWFNPFVWIAGSLLVQVQEWQADRDVIDAGYDVYEYRNSIFRQLYGLGPDVELTSGLYSKLTKKRFLMMTNFKKGRFPLVRMGVAVLVMVAMILAFGAVKDEDKIVYNSPSQISEFIVEESETSGLMQVENSKIEQDTVKDKYPPTVKYPAGIVVPENEKQIILNKGTYEVFACGYKSKDNQVFPNVVIMVLNDRELAIKNKGDWQLVESGVYSYMLTDKHFIVARDDKKYTFGVDRFSGPLYKTTFDVIIPDDAVMRSLTFLGPMETRDSSVHLGFKYGKAYLNGKETSIQELSEVHHINFAVPTVDLGRVKQTLSIGDIIEKNTSQTVSEKEKTEPEESPNASVAQSSTVKNNTKIYLPSGYDTKHEWTKVPMDKREPIFQTIPVFEFLDDSQVQIKSPKTNTYITSGLYKYEFKGGKLYLKGEHDYVFPFKKSFDGDANEHLNIYINTELYGVKIKYVSLSLVNK